ncbi:ABC transporter substrate-binding protein [Nocardioides ungokensis]|uniref:ABC transporter substrate-binding protein n=1 Tax=Nocardioides ungokensis TaxID=1643322 RepID=UPI001FECCA2E|nr:ABC transporter substrate-binding protein [Nocardioides ungokensis]
MRIVSLLPSTTEILFAIGAGPDVVGVTFECDHPAEARSRSIVSTSAMPEGLTPSEIDSFVTSAMARGEDLYHLDEGALAGLDADLVVTQDLCAVCAVDVSVVDDALAHLGCTAEVLTIDPHTIDEVHASIRTLGRATGHEAEAAALVDSLCARLDGVRRRVAGRPRPRVMLLEWTDPPFAPGHWVPEMIEAAGVSRCSGRPVRSPSGSPGRPCTRRRPRSSSWRRAATTWRGPRSWPTSWWPPACCRRASPCIPSTPTPPGHDPAPVWSTASRSWPRSCTVELGLIRS